MDKRTATNARSDVYCTHTNTPSATPLLRLPHLTHCTIYFALCIVTYLSPLISPSLLFPGLSNRLGLCVNSIHLHTSRLQSASLPLTAHALHRSDYPDHLTCLRIVLYIYADTGIE